MLTGMRRSGGITWLVAPGLATIAVTYGLARFAYGLFLPEMRESLDLSDSVLGLIGAGSYTGYCLAVLGALVLTSRSGPRLMALAAGSVAVVGMAIVAGAPTGLVLALGVLLSPSPQTGRKALEVAAPLPAVLFAPARVVPAHTLLP